MAVRIIHLKDGRTNLVPLCRIDAVLTTFGSFADFRDEEICIMFDQGLLFAQRGRRESRIQQLAHEIVKAVATIISLKRARIENHIVTGRVSKVLGGGCETY